MFIPSVYETAALDLTRQNIRLVELQPASESDSVIKCNFHCSSLSTCPPYIALSYTWGPANNLKEIQINGCRFMIRENLWWFLYHMRIRNQQKLFWIDALCINQSNISERNHQVNLMMQVYINAALVTVWLGQAADNSDIAMDYVREKGLRPIRQKRSGLRNIWNTTEGKAVLALCERRCWRRIWIVQEIMAAEKIEIICGQKSVQWRNMDQVIRKLQHVAANGRIEHHPYAAAVLESYAGRILEHKNMWENLPPGSRAVSLERLLEMCHNLDCTDIRDKVYALLGLTKTGNSSGQQHVTADYSKSPEEVYVDVLREVIRSGELETKEDKKRFSVLLQQSLKVCSSNSFIESETRLAIEMGGRTDIIRLDGNVYNTRSMDLLLNQSLYNFPQNMNIYGQILLDPAGLQELKSRFNCLLNRIQARWQVLSEEARLATVARYDSSDSLAQTADERIRRFKTILGQMDELQVELNKVRQIREIVKSWKAKVDAFDNCV